jgi:hypothetical protein
VRAPSYATGFASCAAESEYPQLWRGLRGLWVPALGQTGARVLDWSGLGNHGTVTASTSWANGPGGAALYRGSFVTREGMIEVPASPTLALVNTGSVVARVRHDLVDYNDRIVGFGANGYWQFMTANPVAHVLRFYSQNSVNSSFGLPLLEWHSVGFSLWRSAGQVLFFLDGRTDQKTIGATGGNSSAALHIGWGGHASYDCWRGAIDFVGIWDRPLGISEGELLTGDPTALLRPRRRVYKASAATPSTIALPTLALTI